MITPGFFGLFNAHRGLVATQNALNTVNHNVTNANTAGYSRQRVDLTAYFPYAVPTLNGPDGGQLGQGPTVQQVTRSRDMFLDAQYRLSNGVLGMNTSYRNALQQVEGIIGEPSTGGLNSSIQNFLDSAQEMSLHPESSAVLNDYIQHAVDMLNVFQQQANQLISVRTNLVGDPTVPSTLATSQAAIQVTQINEKLQAIVNLNKSIVTVQSSGANANDLLDQRDLLVDQLSGLVDVKVDNLSTGQINLSIGGQMMIQGNNLLDTLQITTNAGPVPAPDDVPALISTVNGGVVLNDGTGAEITSGSLKGIVDMGGNNPNFSTIRSVLGKLDTLAQTIVDQVNTLQTTGRDQYGNLGTAMFTLNAGMSTQALNIFHWEVNPTVQGDPKRIATAADDASAPGNYAGIGDGRNALKIAQLRDQTFAALGTGFVDYLNGVVSKLGIDTKSYEDSTASQSSLLQSVDLQRQSVSGVNIEEEMIDMLRYQRAFQATSKTIAMFDDVYKTIIEMAG
jgi:flagellar hook-associated protein 1